MRALRVSGHEGRFFIDSQGAEELSFYVQVDWNPGESVMRKFQFNRGEETYSLFARPGRGTLKKKKKKQK